jgi:hypothetical protein
MREQNTARERGGARWKRVPQRTFGRGGNGAPRASASSPSSAKVTPQRALKLRAAISRRCDRPLTRGSGLASTRPLDSSFRGPSRSPSATLPSSQMKRRSMLPTLLFVLVGSHLGDGAQLPPPITSEALKDYCISSRWGFTCLANSRAGPFLPRSRLLMAGAAASVSIRATLWDLGPCDLARASPALANPKGVFDTRLRSPWRCTTRCQRRISSCCSMPGARDHSRLPHGHSRHTSVRPTCRFVAWA